MLYLPDIVEYYFMKENPGQISTQLTPANVLENLGIGVYAVELIEGQRPRMLVDPIMASLLGCSPDLSPEDIYEFWHRGVDEEAEQLLDANMKRMIDGQTSEVQYKWNHPDGSRRVIRCGGRRNWSYTDRIRCEGTHRDLTKISHIDDDWKSRSLMLKSYFNYYNSRDALAILIVNLKEDRYSTVKTTPEIESRLPLNEEGEFSRYMHKFVELYIDKSQAGQILNFQRYDFLDNYFRSSPVYRQHFSSLDPKGELRWYRITANRLANDDMVVSFEDRTLKVSENIIQNTISSRQVGGFIFNLERNFITVVKTTPFFNYLDENTEKLTIPHGIELLCPHIDEEFRDGWRAFAGSDNLQAVYNNHRRADYAFKAIFAGEHTWLRASLYPVDRKLSEEPAVAVVFRKYSKEELENVRQNEQLEHDFNLIHGIAAQYVSLKVVRIDGNFSVIYKDLDQSLGWNSRAFNTLYDSYAALMKAHCHPDDFKRMIEFSKKEYIMGILKGRRRHQERFRFRMPDGEYRWMDVVLIRYGEDLNEDLKEFAFALADVDLEVRRESEYAQAIEQARISKEESQLKTQFVNNISHDIRTPLNAVIGYSQLLTLAGDSLSEEEKTEYVKYIESSGELLTMLIDDILSISDIEHDILKIRFSTASCNNICRKAVSCSMMRVPNGVNLYFTSEYDDFFCINTDPKRVQQILINMLSNSCKATTEGEIRVHCCPSREDGFVDFIVTDTGCGVPPEKADEIFNRFVSVDNNENGAGHGLGLDICIKISKRMGGYIWLDQSYTGGAKFVLTLPVER